MEAEERVSRLPAVALALALVSALALADIAGSVWVIDGDTIEKGCSSLGGGMVVRFSRIWMSAGECRLKWFGGWKGSARHQHDPQTDTRLFAGTMGRTHFVDAPSGVLPEGKRDYNIAVSHPAVCLPYHCSKIGNRASGMGSVLPDYWDDILCDAFAACGYRSD